MNALVGASWRRSAAVVAAAVLTGLVALAAAGGAQGTVHKAPSPTAGPIRFSHAVIVDEQRPGFEPDVKVDGKGVIYSSVPNGFSTTISYVWFSHDHGNSYLTIPGTIGVGKPATCVGGGDSDLFLDPGNALYFSDLQGLTNISDSVSTNGGKTWSTNCAGAGPNTPDDRMWYGGKGSLAKGNLLLYQDFDVVAGSASTGNNALVETVSTNGTVFQPVVNSSPSSDCAGLAIQDCVTGNEGISGNQVVDPKTGNVYIAHTTTEGSSGEVGVRVSEGKITAGSPTMATWSESPNLDGPLCPGSTKTADGSRSCVDKNGNPEEIAGENFATIARDSAGYLYVTFTAGPLDHKSSSDPNFGALTAPEQIYVVHSLGPAGQDPSKVKWSKPLRISGTGLSAGTNTFPWITAGSDGRVAVAWYHTSEKSEKGTCASGSGRCTLYGASSLSKAEWTVQLGESLNAHSSHPSYTAAKVSEGPVKSGQICTNGIGCTTGGDRSLGDFLQVTTDRTGAAVVSFVFDTSQDSSDGEEVGPDAISRQISGPSLFASVGHVTQGNGPGQAMGSVKDPAKDDFYSAGGKLTPAGANLDLRGASLANGPKKTLVARIKVRSLRSLSVSPSLGGPDASWIIRWTVVHPGKTSAGIQTNGDIYYAGMDNNAGAGGSGKPSFFVGDTSAVPPPGNPAEHTKYMTFPQSKLLSAKQASYNRKTGVITLRIPLSDVGKPSRGTRLYSITAFTATSLAPESQNTLFNQVDATPPFELVIGHRASSRVGHLQVFVGYADTFRAKSAQFPTPWAPAVRVYGNTCAKRRCDNGAIRLLNTGPGPLRVRSVVVRLGTCTFDSWPHNLRIAPGKQIILSNEGHRGVHGCPTPGFDTSEIGPRGKRWNGDCHQSGVIPQVAISTASGTTVYRDTGQVLNTGGVDKSACPKGSNESVQWTLIGRHLCPRATLALAPRAQKHLVKAKATVMATLSNAGGPGCGRALQGARIKFRVLSGPDAGRSATALTNAQGRARFTYSSSHPGTDELQAATTNPAGTILSRKVKITWT